MSDDLKYIVDEYGNIAVFSPTATHADVARQMHGKIVGAGFVRFNTETETQGAKRIHCFGESISCHVTSRKEVDEAIILNKLFRED